MSISPSLWDDAGSEAEREDLQRRLAVARVASRDLTGFLVTAATVEDFTARASLVEADLDRIAVTAGVSRQDLLSDLNSQRRLVVEAAGGHKCACGHASTHHADGGACPTCGCQEFRPASTASKDYDPALCSACQQRPGNPSNPEGMCGQCMKDAEDYRDRNRPDDDRQREAAKQASRECPSCGGSGGTFSQDRHGRIKESPCQACEGTGRDWGGPTSDHDADERDSYERYHDYGDYRDPGDAQDDWYHGDYLASLKTALEEGQDPLAWLEQGGQGAPEKPGGHMETGVATDGPNAAQQAQAARKQAIAEPGSYPASIYGKVYNSPGEVHSRIGEIADANHGVGWSDDRATEAGHLYHHLGIPFPYWAGHAREGAKRPF